MTRNRIPAENTLAVTLHHSASLGPRHQLRKFTISLVRINLGLRLHKTFLVLPPPSEPFRKPQNYLAQQNNNNDGIDARLMIHIASENALKSGEYKDRQASLAANAMSGQQGKKN